VVVEVIWPRRDADGFGHAGTDDALFDAHGIPRHVVIDEGAAELEVEALGGGVGAEEVDTMVWV